jgi:hypothetical protein
MVTGIKKRGQPNDSDDVEAVASGKVNVMVKPHDRLVPVS